MYLEGATMPGDTKPKEVKTYNRVVVLDNVYYQRHNESPVQFSRPFEVRLTSREQPYSREVEIGEEWEPLELMWVKDPGVVLLDNLETAWGAKTPTPQEIEEVKKKILQVAFLRTPGVEASRTMHSSPSRSPPEYPALEVLPGMNQRLWVARGCGMWVRSASGIIRYTVTAFPRD